MHCSQISRLSSAHYPLLNKSFTKPYYQSLLYLTDLPVSGTKHTLQLRLLAYVRHRYSAAIRSERTTHVPLFVSLIKTKGIPADVLKLILEFVLSPLDQASFRASFALAFESRSCKAHYDARLLINGRWTPRSHHVVLVDRGLYTNNAFKKAPHRSDRNDDVTAIVAVMVLPSMDIFRMSIDCVILSRCRCNFIDNFFDYQKLEVHSALGRYLCVLEDKQLMLAEKADYLVREKANLPLLRYL